MKEAEVLHRARELGLPAYGDDEVLFMAETMERLRPTHIFEWGTNIGASARIFYEATQILDLACEVHTIELPPDLAHLDRDHPGERLGLHITGTPVHQHLGDGLEVSIAVCVGNEPERALFYVDGCHDYECVTREIEGLSAFMPEAVLLLHDTEHLASVAAALETFLAYSGDHYESVHLASGAGMTALWPLPV